MSEAAKVEGGKKKGKMPMMIALVVMLGAGGFFGMKMGGGGSKKEEPKIELGEVVPLGEFLVNLSDGRSFLKTDISVQIAKNGHLDEAKGGGHEGKAEPPAAVRDAVVSVLSSQDMNAISTPQGKLELKKAIAKAINAVVPHEQEKDHKKKSSKKHKDDDEEILDESWDSQTGPVLKVYFTTFATQQ